MVDSRFRIRTRRTKSSKAFVGVKEGILKGFTIGGKQRRRKSVVMTIIFLFEQLFDEGR